MKRPPYARYEYEGWSDGKLLCVRRFKEKSDAEAMFGNFPVERLNKLVKISEKIHKVGLR